MAADRLAVNDADLKRVALDNVEQAGSALVAVGPKAIRASADGGASWKRVPLPKDVKLADASFTTAKAGFVLGRNGRVLRTANSGRKWKESFAIGTGKGYGISFSSPRRKTSPPSRP